MAAALLSRAEVVARHPEAQEGNSCASRTPPPPGSGRLASLEALRRAEGLGAMEECQVVRPAQGLLLTNPSRFPVAEVASDAGAPAAFEILTPGVRGAVALPAPDGGLDLRVFHPGA